MIVRDGPKVWLHDVDLNQVSVRLLDQALRNAPRDRPARRVAMGRESAISGAGSREGARLSCGLVQRDTAMVRFPKAERIWSGVEGAGTLIGWVKGQARQLSIVQGDEIPCRSAEAAPLSHANF